MKKYILKFISSILIIAVTLSPLSNLNLTIWADTVDDSVFDEILAVDDPVQDAKFDWGVGNIAGDWNKATKVDYAFSFIIRKYLRLFIT